MGQRARFPAPLDNDHEDVHWALSTASSLHAQGDNDEALRWLRKAVAAAVACDLDARAIELGRCAADLEESIAAASTERGAKRPHPTLDESTTRSVVKRRVADTLTDAHLVAGLDDPTYIDSRGAPSTVNDEPTLVPYTQTSPGMHGEVPSTIKGGPPQRPFQPHTETLLTADQIVNDGVYEDDEQTVAMHRAPNENDLESRRGPPNQEATMPAMSSMTRFRVALVASPDGHDPRAILLSASAEAPPGAGVAMLIPASDEDADVVRSLLRARKK